jgi:hypothetical protein
MLNLIEEALFRNDTPKIWYWSIDPKIGKDPHAKFENLIL